MCAGTSALPWNHETWSQTESSLSQLLALLSVPTVAFLHNLLRGSADSRPGACLPLLISYITNDSLHESNSKSDLVDQICYVCSDWGGERQTFSCEEEERLRQQRRRSPQRKYWHDLNQEQCKMQLNWLEGNTMEVLGVATGRGSWHFFFLFFNKGGVVDLVECTKVTSL